MILNADRGYVGKDRKKWRGILKGNEIRVFIKAKIILIAETIEGFISC
jgi:hypothetical protein